MFYTKKGDNGMTSLIGGQTKIFGCDQRISKSSTIAEALGSLDEANSFLGLCKVQSAYLGYKLGHKNFSEIVHDMQRNLFIIQAELGGADKTIEKNKVKELEEIIDDIEKELPPIKHFFISGGPAEITKWQQPAAGLGAIFDIARTLARKAERRVIAVNEEMAQPSLLNVEDKENPASASPLSRATASEVGKHTMAYLNRLSSALYVLARYANHKVGIMEEAPDYR
jgi:cob(I)alamin adenosyltransferase